MSSNDKNITVKDDKSDTDIETDIVRTTFGRSERLGAKPESKAELFQIHAMTSGVMNS